MRAGRAIRDNRNDAVAARTPCSNCEHPITEHRELPYGSEGYEPLAFHCSQCVCVIRKGVR